MIEISQVVGWIVVILLGLITALLGAGLAEFFSWRRELVKKVDGKVDADTCGKLREIGCEPMREALMGHSHTTLPPEAEVIPMEARRRR